jgi:hypothetical protein
MGYDIDILSKDGEQLHATDKHDIKGSTYAIGGTTRLELSITYNYSSIISGTPLDSVRDLNGEKVSDTIKTLTDSIADIMSKHPLAWNVDTGNYWNPTAFNAKKALESLLELAQLGLATDPECKWSIS